MKCSVYLLKLLSLLLFPYTHACMHASFAFEIQELKAQLLTTHINPAHETHVYIYI